MVICSFLKFGMVKVLETSQNISDVKNLQLQIKMVELLNIFLFLNKDFDEIVSFSLSPKKVHGPLTIRMHCNWPLLNVQLMVNEASLFTFWHWTHGCDVNVVKNYLKYAYFELTITLVAHKSHLSGWFGLFAPKFGAHGGDLWMPFAFLWM